jgi:hypothetical protein
MIQTSSKAPTNGTILTLTLTLTLTLSLTLTLTHTLIPNPNPIPNPRPNPKPNPNLHLSWVVINADDDAVQYETFEVLIAKDRTRQGGVAGGRFALECEEDDRSEGFWFRGSRASSFFPLAALFNCTSVPPDEESTSSAVDVGGGEWHAPVEQARPPRRPTLSSIGGSAEQSYPVEGSSDSAVDDSWESGNFLNQNMLHEEVDGEDAPPEIDRMETFEFKYPFTAAELTQEGGGVYGMKLSTPACRTGTTFGLQACLMLCATRHRFFQMWLLLTPLSPLPLPTEEHD